MERGRKKSLRNEVDKLLNRWNELAGSVENAVKSRNYRKFRLSYRKAEQCSQRIQFLMRHGHVEPFLEKKDTVKRLVERWNTISETLIRNWKDETERKISLLRHRQRKEDKINKAYNFTKLTGKSVKMKAR